MMPRNRAKFKREPYKNRLGERYITNQGCWLTISKYTNNEDIEVTFDDGNKRQGITFASIKRGNVTNFFHKHLYNIGYIGVSKYLKKANRMSYGRWNNMFNRCYDPKFQEKYPTYKDVEVCEEWHNYQNFEQWYEENWKPCMDKTWHVDKDIIVKGNKVYSPETCAFVPQEINKLLIHKGVESIGSVRGSTKTGDYYIVQISINNRTEKIGKTLDSEEAFQIYKIAKEQYIKEVADKWKDLIDPRVYKALINYKIEK